MATVAPEVPLLARDEAFEKLYRRYVKDVYHYALALLRNPADAEDVTQTTFMNAYRAFRRGDEILKPQNWLIKIAHNVARSRYARTTRRVKEVPLDDHLEQLALPDDERPEIENVLRALGRLPFNQRAALIMRELEGRSYVEISDTLGVSVAAVETLIFRARRSLRVRASALKSIAAVPLPGSLTHLFGGGGAVAGGVGGGFLTKAAVALVAGAFATGIGSDSNNGAVAADKAGPAAAPVSSTSVALRAPVAGQGKATRPASAAERRQGSARVVRQSVLTQSAVTGSAPSGSASTPTATAAGDPGAASIAPTAPSVPSVPVTVPSPTAVVEDTVQTAVDTVQQTVATVNSAVATQVASLPVELPPLPKLP
jgi:RNA polymerase sigma factor (sigma-70 family)